jgi:hypothetical protein
MPVFERVRRKLSRTKSVPAVVEAGDDDEDQDYAEIDLPSSKALPLPDINEHFVSRLKFTDDTEFITRAPRQQTPSIATGMSERTVFNDVESGFLSLPTELLVFLQPYLKPSSEVALRYSCSRFFHLYSTPSFLLTGKDLFDFLCMIERDQDPTKLDKLVCGQCQDLHLRTTFPPAEVRKDPTLRDCRQVWLCAHRHMGYRKTIRAIKAGVESPFRVETLEPCSRCRNSIRNRSVAERPEKGTSQRDLESSKAQSLLISKIGLLQTPSPSYNRRTSGGSGLYKEVFPVSSVSSSLQAVDFRICPHLKLGDPYILSKFCRACLNTQRLPPGVKGPPCIGENKRDVGEAKRGTKCKGSCFTRGCKTQFMFQARESLSPDASGRRQVWLIIVVYRWLGPLLASGSDPTWYSHAVDDDERKEMRNKWSAWDTFGGICMPNWDICLLHPEDSNLR